MRVKTSPLFEIARVLVCLDHVASRIVNANHSIIVSDCRTSVSDCVADCVRLAVPQPSERSCDSFCDRASSHGPADRVPDPVFLALVFRSNSPAAKARANPAPTPMSAPYTLQTGGPGTAGLSMQCAPDYGSMHPDARKSPIASHSIVVLRGSSGVKALPIFVKQGPATVS
jgi:hypothetical protein